MFINQYNFDSQYLIRYYLHLYAQVLSTKVGRALQRFGPEMSETAKFVLMCDRFFDCLNGKYDNEDLATKKQDSLHSSG